ncbi:MAG: MFS transporter, partial [Nocardioidaceae bacterium]|nr:MFS transporter [Nocardioidaceae bacterium]
MLSTYRRVLGLPGALVFSLAGLVGRLPISMVSLGIVVLVSTRTGSYSLAGTVSASYLIANAAFAVPQARLVDRLGQHRVLPVAISVFAVGLVLMMVAVERDWPTPWPHVFAAVGGIGMPQIGSSVRARWAHLVDDRRLLRTAFAFEAVVDETVFVVGPTVVVLLATTLHPLAGLGAAVTAGVVGTTVLVSQRRTEPPVGRGREGHGPGSMPWRVLGPLTLSSFTMGVLFGGAEVAAVAFSDEQGTKAMSGVLLAIWSLGSLLSGAVTGAVHVGGSNATRFRWGLLTLGVLLVPLPFLDGFVTMSVVLFLAGFAISPTLSAGVAWVEEIVPPGRITEGITVLTTGLAAGVAPGAALVGVVVDAAGASASFWVCALA